MRTIGVDAGASAGVGVDAGAGVGACVRSSSVYSYSDSSASDARVNEDVVVDVRAV